MTVLAIEDVWFSYGNDAVLRGVTASIAAGDTVALLGRNGAGKTTLTKLVVALLAPARGSIRVCDVDTDGKHPEDLVQDVAYVFQHPHDQLFARTVRDEVAFGPVRLGRSDTQSDRAVRDALRDVGLLEQCDTHPYDLSPAERKLVTLAAALALEPKLLVLDEPTQGLDRAGRELVCAIVRNLATRGVAVLTVTHDLTLATESLERVWVLVDGTIDVDEPMYELIRDEDRVARLGLGTPPAARVSQALDLPGRPIRMADVSEALARRFHGRSASSE